MVLARLAKSLKFWNNLLHFILEEVAQASFPF